ncbi:PREDICTED: ubiquitin-like-specific protease 1D isoform X3 [Nelumbo nucifera]|uniref:Ubiquitin-like-specific protease 1D isoform X3 n=1 Tax=Nelumbo nucifera TaxID=4432 RepID=A0A1U7YUQ2_NELNU|nr:PREDICTED: ubiquitin-like-specific protease 1D isoform X3 [Nelumbo nucifera]
MEGENKPLDIDWKKVLPVGDDDPPPDLVVISGESQNQKDEVESIPDYQLNDKIKRAQKNIGELSSKLPDNGAKLRANLKRLEEERERRRLLRLKKDADECEMVMQLQSSRLSGADSGLSRDAPSSQACPQSSFSSLFVEKLDGKPDGTSHTTDKAFDNELSILHCGNKKNTRSNGHFSHKEKNGSRMSIRQSPFRCSGSYNLDKEKVELTNGDNRGIASGPFLHSKSLSSHLSKKFCAHALSLSMVFCSAPEESTGSNLIQDSQRNASQVQSPLNSRTRKHGQALVLVDEEDCLPVEMTKQEDGLVGRLKDNKIYYPSRDDPESVELCYSDIKCLDPEAFLSSTIMNFYIRYLQRPASLTSRPRGDYHIFNTYFYKKLKDAVLCKKSEKDTFFAKFRRWWKGVNIFLKAYILLPIHENLHWSLVIICFPDKEDESGPIILHLDSLGYHISSQIFENIKSFLRKEWEYLRQEATSSDLPFADRIWQNLPRRIDDKIITVPQQKNDYDCGIFVLFFMERFIKEAPERLRKKDLAMFGKQWFKPEEASGLRERIRKLLLEEFQNADIEDCSRESSPTSSGDSGGKDRTLN